MLAADIDAQIGQDIDAEPRGTRFSKSGAPERDADVWNRAVERQHCCTPATETDIVLLKHSSPPYPENNPPGRSLSDRPDAIVVERQG
jgi:hypothetical protein